MAESCDLGSPQTVADLQVVAGDVWRARGGPPASLHVGDVPWRLRSVPVAVENARIRVWREGDEAVAWGWLSPPEELTLVLDPKRGDAVLDEILAWAEQEAGRPVKVDALDTDEELVGLLAARGYGSEPDETPYVFHTVELEGIEPARAPDGYRFRPVSFPDDLQRRVDVHRAAFGTPERPSRVTPESYAAVTSSWPYEPGLDWVAEAPDGSFAAFCLVWPDDANGVGLLEPVGAHPDHRRRGLARGVCRAALGALRGRGAEVAVVTAVTDEARALYRSLGFREAGQFQWLTRPPAG